MKIIDTFKDIYHLLGFGENLGESKIPPCQTCGACCSYYKIGFTEKINNQVPVEMTVKINDKSSAMMGADIFKGKCVAFNGEIGKDCACSIYSDRPNVCREFPVYMRNGKQNPKCFKARIFHGLPGEI